MRGVVKGLWGDGEGTTVTSLVIGRFEERHCFARSVRVWYIDQPGNQCYLISIEHCLSIADFTLSKHCSVFWISLFPEDRKTPSVIMDFLKIRVFPSLPPLTILSSWSTSNVQESDWILQFLAPSVERASIFPFGNSVRMTLSRQASETEPESGRSFRTKRCASQPMRLRKIGSIKVNDRITSYYFSLDLLSKTKWYLSKMRSKLSFIPAPEIQLVKFFWGSCWHIFRVLKRPLEFGSWRVNIHPRTKSTLRLQERLCAFPGPIVSSTN